MPSHTPGPWIIGGEKLRDPNCIIIHTGKGESIASVWNLMHSDGSEPNTPLVENAALIAAAPDLLAACKAAYTHVEMLYGAEDCLAEQLKTAIDKAQPKTEVK